MGNALPCGGDSSSSRGSPGTRGGLLSNNISGFSSRSSGSIVGGDPGKNEHNNRLGCNNSILWRHDSIVNFRQHLRVRRPKLRAVLALSKQGHLYDTVKWACDRLNVESSHAPSTDTAIAACKDGVIPSLLVLDCRNYRNIDAEAVAKAVHQNVVSEVTVIVGIVKKSFYDKEEIVIESHLSAGFSRILLDSSSRGYWLNELAWILRNDCENALKSQCFETMLSALNNCRDIVQITDDENKLMFSNLASERVLGFKDDDVKDRSLWELQTISGLAENSMTEKESTLLMHGSEIVRQKLDLGKSWDGFLSCKRKTGDFIQLETRAIPISIVSKGSPDHIVYVKQPPPLFREKSFSELYETPPIPQNTSVPAPTSGHHGFRRQSNAKMHSLSVEAPITKVINIILAAQENSPLYIAQALDRVLDILQATDSINLFSPEVERERKKKTDAVTTDLLGALLAHGPKPFEASGTSLSRSNSVISRQSSVLRTSSRRRRNSTRDVLNQRRSSSETGSAKLANVSGAHAGHRPSMPNLDNSPIQLRELLEKSDTWSHFNILELEQLTEKRCLLWLGMSTLLRFEVHKTLKCSETTLQNWLTVIEANYKTSNTYHNSTHAADVLHATACFLDSPKVKDYCDELDEAACLIAAVIHDVNHPGRNSAFLCNSGSELAYLYNDITVLENHHASLGFKLSTSDKRVNIFDNLDRDTYKLMRQSVIDMVLATDMSKHFVHVNKFNSVFGRTMLKEDDNASGQGISMMRSPGGNAGPTQDGAISPVNSEYMIHDVPNTAENVAILKRMIIKCADISNPARPLKICQAWAYRIAEEYFTQTDDEKKLGLPVVMPQFDRTTCSIPKSQIGFYDFFIIDMFEMWNGFTDLQELMDIINSNYSYWKLECEREESGEKKHKIPGDHTFDEQEEDNHAKADIDTQLETIDEVRKTDIDTLLSPQES
ncbi:high affinity cAMP-specific and IBMX-insensitive 3',5'-cyclic phosphodiesterase 8A-like isoform X2 [Tigriopus californicus]|uniref:high affinity cAMP-specific and IBMX-insensitive 3',5'-cyclic phosphodiesterase 8A-like isoform X2 n=1 Tax=Tigriopus californicus TaxID=6832 RepID=UPI0027DA202A|nr:high affinity cAMP-specific and IBMX-insensitive 3',5'-cyclic phosphodiesterase 8A-like isoform X2 [Tigriopus californicus]